MKKILHLERLAVLAFILLTGMFCNAQPLLTENFDYANGTLLSAAGWSAHSGTGTNAVDVVVPGLSFSGYALSNVGGAAQIDNTGEDVNKTFASQASGSVYVAFMVKVDVMAVGYFLHLGQATIGTTYFSRVWLNAGTSGFKFGLGKGSETSPVNTTTEYTLGTTYLLVLKYNIIDGTTNDEISLYVINGAIPATEPATATIPAFTTTAADYSPGSVALRQYDGSQRITVDGIRIGKTWAEAVTTTSTADVTPPVFSTGFPKLTNIKPAQADLQVNLDEAGKAFYVVVKDGDAAPTAAQVFAGVNYGAVTLLSAGSITLASGGTAGTATLTGLTDKTNYDIYVVAQDDEATPNKQATPVKLDLYTSNPPDVLKTVDFTTALAPFTQVSITGDQLWNKAEYSGNSYAYINGYSSGNKENNDWLISPVLNLDTATSVKVSFKTAKSYTGPALKVMISSNFNGTFTPAGVNGATWTDITSNFEYSGGSFAWKASGEFALSAYSGKVYIAFVYESTTEAAAAWEVDDFLLTGYLKNTSIDQLEENDITVYPVPAKEEIHFGNLKGVNTLDIFDLQSRMLLQKVVNGLNNVSLNVSSLPNGVYLVRFHTSGIPVVKRFIKSGI